MHSTCGLDRRFKEPVCVYNALCKPNVLLMIYGIFFKANILSPFVTIITIL
jgi:hypothetical protein